MNMGNSMMLVIGGLLLMGTFMLSANSLLLQNTTTSQQNECFLTAISLAQSVIDEAKTKAFDEKTVGGPVSVRDSLTSSSLFGKDGSGETVPVPDTLSANGFISNTKFDDVDDYNGYQRRATTTRTGPLTVSAVVQYASETFPDSTLSARAYCKLMTVTVTGPQLAVPVSIQYAFTY
jgi:hypothetical protein